MTRLSRRGKAFSPVSEKPHPSHLLLDLRTLNLQAHIMGFIFQAGNEARVAPAPNWETLKDLHQRERLMW